jgi:carnosine N-methyltransferase
LSANHARRTAFLALPKEQREIYDSVGYREKLEAVDEGIRRYVPGLISKSNKGADGRNAEFIDEMIKDPVFADMLDPPDDNENTDPIHSHNHSHSHSHLHGNGNARGGPSKQGERDSSQEKVRSTLRSFVRDWSDFGKQEREACYSPILEVLGREFPEERGGKKVLIPGCGLGRLAMEVAAMGMSVLSHPCHFTSYLVRVHTYRVTEARLKGEMEGSERKMGN